MMHGTYAFASQVKTVPQLICMELPLGESCGVGICMDLMLRKFIGQIREGLLIRSAIRAISVIGALVAFF